MRKHLIRGTTIATTFALIFATSAVAKREVARVGNLFLADNGGILPSRLPRHRQVPISGRIQAEIGTTDGSHPPAVREVNVDFDRTIQLHAKGVPVCRGSQLEARDTKAAKRVCGKAIVGSGSARVEIAFPEQRPITTTSPLVVFNGGVRGRRTTMFIHAFITVPVPAAVVTRVRITRKRRGRYGMNADAKIPPIAGGAGSATYFKLALGRRFTYRGRKKSYLTASCPTGSYLTKGHVLFADGTRLGLTHVLPCTPRR